MKVSSILFTKLHLPAVVLICSILSGLIFSCSTHHEDYLDRIKKFKPEDKYFKFTLVSLHFMMETSPVEEVDTLFRQLIEI